MSLRIISACFTLFCRLLRLCFARVLARGAADLFAAPDKVFAAFGAFFARGQVPAHELALGVRRTAVIDLARLALHAAGRRAAYGAGARKLGDGLAAAAFGAAQVLAVPPLAVDHEFPAFGAFFFGNFALVGQDSVAFGVIGAGEELAVLAAFDDHVRAALGALGRRHFRALAFDVRTGGVVGAGEELAVPPVAADHGVPALFAEDVRHLVAVVGGKDEFFGKGRVKIR